MKNFIKKLLWCIPLVLFLSACGGNNSGNNPQIQAQNHTSLTRSQAQELPINLSWSIDGESQPVANLKDMGWHVLTATVESIGYESTPISAPVDGIQYQINSISTPDLSVSVVDINCNSAVFTQVGDNCSTYIRLSYGESASGQYLAQVVFATGSLPLIPGETLVTDKIDTNSSVADYRIIMPIESAYYQASAVSESPGQYQMLSLENGLIAPFDITSFGTPTNSTFSLMHRTTNGLSDPYYGSYNECSASSNPAYNQVSTLSNLNESCILVYQASESAAASQESGSFSLYTDAALTFPYNAGSYTLQANYNFGLQINWMLTTLPSGQNWNVTYGNGSFVAVGYPGEQSGYCESGAISSDGINWTPVSLPGEDSGIWVNIAYGNGKFVAVGEEASGDRVAISSDGINWTSPTTIPMASYPGYLTYANGEFIIFNDNNCSYNPPVSSPDGISWTSITLPYAACWISAAYGNGIFIATGEDVNNQNQAVEAISLDGINWTPVALPAGNPVWTSVTYGDGKFVAMNAGSNLGWVSVDGVNWTPVTMSTESQNWSSMIYSNGFFIAIVQDSDTVVTSVDGINWFPTTSLPSTDGIGWTSIAYGNGVFVTTPTFNSTNLAAVGSVTNTGGSLSNFTMSDYSGD